MLDNVQTVLDFVLKNADALPAEKIEAMAKVIESLKNYTPADPSPNRVGKSEGNDFSDELPRDLSEVTGIQIDDNKPTPVQIISDKS